MISRPSSPPLFKDTCLRPRAAIRGAGALRQDLADSELSPGRPLPVPETDDAFRDQYDRMVQAVLPTLHRDLGTDVGKMVINLVATEIASQIALRVTTATASRLGVSAGLLGCGAYTGTFTLAQASPSRWPSIRHSTPSCATRATIPKAPSPMSWITRSTSSPRSILEGDPGPENPQPGLRHELIQLQQARARVRDAALHKLIVEGGE